MPSTAIFCGVLLVLIGIAGAIAAVSNDKSFVTALIPAFFGIVLIILGYLARIKDNLRKHLMHGALLVALLGFVGGFFSPGIKGLITTGKVADMVSFSAQLAMMIVCLLFLVLGIKSFIDARRNS